MAIGLVRKTENCNGRTGKEANGLGPKISPDLQTISSLTKYSINCSNKNR